MRRLRAIRRKRFIVELARTLGVKAEIKLVLPAKFKPRLADGIIPVLRSWMTLRQVRRMRGNFICCLLYTSDAADE